MNPLWLAPFVPPPAPGGNAAAPHVPEHILVVEDDNTIQSFIAMALENAGYRVDKADDGEAGWQAMSANHFDLLITDNNMPKLSGVNLMRRLRAIPLTLPIILISGKIPWETKDLKTLISPGTAMEKPFTMAQLLQQVRTLLMPIVSCGVMH